MEIKVTLDENTIEKLFNNFCENNECSSCSCQIILEDEYEACNEKYRETILKNDFNSIINEVVLKNL